MNHRGKGIIWMDDNMEPCPTAKDANSNRTIKDDNHQTQSSMSIAIDFTTVFFFQAEDGIRDVAVTGVQMCSSDLPLSTHARWPVSESGTCARSEASLRPCIRAAQ